MHLVSALSVVYQIRRSRFKQVKAASDTDDCACLADTPQTNVATIFLSLRVGGVAGPSTTTAQDLLVIGCTQGKTSVIAPGTALSMTQARRCLSSR